MSNLLQVWKVRILHLLNYSFLLFRKLCPLDLPKNHEAAYSAIPFSPP